VPAVLTDEPRVGGQAGLVIVLVGAGARRVRRHAAVHRVVSQPRPAQQTPSAARGEKEKQALSHEHMTDEHANTQSKHRAESFWHHFYSGASGNRDRRHTGKVYQTSVCGLGVLNRKPGLAHAAVPTSYLLSSPECNTHPVVVPLFMDESDSMSLI